MKENRNNQQHHKKKRYLKNISTKDIGYGRFVTTRL